MFSAEQLKLYLRLGMSVYANLRSLRKRGEVGVRWVVISGRALRCYYVEEEINL